MGFSALQTEDACEVIFAMHRLKPYSNKGAECHNLHPIEMIKVSPRPGGILPPCWHQLVQMRVSVRKLGRSFLGPLGLVPQLLACAAALSKSISLYIPLKKFSHWFLQLFVTLSRNHSLVMAKPQTTVLKGRVKQMYEWIAVQSNWYGNIYEEAFDANKKRPWSQSWNLN